MQQQQQQQQQQMQQAPPTPQPYADNSSNTALTAQDPYAASPQDLSRYAALFPQYADPADGYKYLSGPAAVALFSKSGAALAALRAIWTMVDADPVDNRLDALEFALAMHLIVCVTKKGLPVPPGGPLPPSLRAIQDRDLAARGGAQGGGQGGDSGQALQ